MRAGILDRLIQFSRYTETDDGYGVKQAWANHGVAQWASKKDVSDGERMAAGWIEATVVSRFVVRWSAFTAALTPADRLTYGDLVYEIHGIKEGDGRRRWIEITAMARNDLAEKPANTVLPIITGIAKEGETLTVSGGEWAGIPAPVLTYAWLAGGSVISGAELATYEAQAGDVGKVITAKVTATNSAGSATAESEPTDAVVAA